MTPPRVETLPRVVTWRHVREATFPSTMRMAAEAGMDTTGWRLTDDEVPFVTLTGGSRYCAWSTARGCAEYLQAWTDLLAVQAWARAKDSAVIPPCTHFEQHGTYCNDSRCGPCTRLAFDALSRNDRAAAED
jgi:hypothetical protein